MKIARHVRCSTLPGSLSTEGRLTKFASSIWAKGLFGLACLASSAMMPTIAHATPKSGGTLTVGLAQDPLVIDPIRTGTFTERQFATPVYESLFDVNAKGEVVPFLVESYSVSEDQKTYRLKLRTGIKFHDGTPFDAQAVEANMERTRNPANRCRCLANYEDFQSVKVIDNLNIEIVLKEPNASLPTLLADSPGIMVSPTAFKNDPVGIGTKPVGTGPFKFVEWIRGSRYVLEKNTEYWQAGRPYLDRLIFRGIQNTETLEATFMSGQADILLQPSFRFASQMKSKPTYTVLNPAGYGTEGVYMNLKVPPLDDIRVRRAIAHSMDRELLRKTLGFSVPTLAYSPFGMAFKIQQPTASYPKYDLAKAKELVAQYGKPVAFTLQYNNSPSTRQLVQSLQEMWAQAGIKVELEALDQNRLVQNMTTKQFSTSIFRFTGRADPHIVTYPFYNSKSADITPSSNYHSYKNPKVDELLDQGKATRDPAKRNAIYSELANTIIQDLPVAHIFNVTDSIVINRKVKGLTVVPDGLVRFADIWKE